MYTSDCRFYISVDDEAFNVLANAIASQRPSLFNFASDWFLENLDELCHSIPQPPNGAPLVTPVDKLKIGSGSGNVGIDYCLQIRGVRLDVHPYTMNLPPEFGNLGPGFAVFAASASMRMAIPEISAGDIPCPADLVGTASLFARSQSPDPTSCFELTFFVALSAGFRACATKTYLYLEAARVEIGDIAPNPLEDALEVYIKAILNAEVLPTMWSALMAIPIKISETEEISLVLYPAPKVQPNPKLDANKLQLFLDARVGTP